MLIEITEVKTIVMVIDKKIAKLGSIEAACEDVDIPVEKYLYYKGLVTKELKDIENEKNN